MSPSHSNHPRHKNVWELVEEWGLLLQEEIKNEHSGTFNALPKKPVTLLRRKSLRRTIAFDQIPDNDVYSIFCPEFATDW